MKTAEEMRAVSKKWFRDGIFKQIERHAENGYLECTVNTMTDAPISDDEIYDLIHCLIEKGYQINAVGFPSHFHVSWRHK